MLADDARQLDQLLRAARQQQKTAKQFAVLLNSRWDAARINSALQRQRALQPGSLPEWGQAQPGCTLLLLAASLGLADVTECLLSWGADHRIVDRSGISPLSAALRSCSQADASCSGGGGGQQQHGNQPSVSRPHTVVRVLCQAGGLVLAADLPGAAHAAKLVANLAWSDARITAREARRGQAPPVCVPAALAAAAAAQTGADAAATAAAAEKAALADVQTGQDGMTLPGIAFSSCQGCLPPLLHCAQLCSGGWQPNSTLLRQLLAAAPARRYSGQEVLAALQVSIAADDDRSFLEVIEAMLHGAGSYNSGTWVCSEAHYQALFLAAVDRDCSAAATALLPYVGGVLGRLLRWTALRTRDSAALQLLYQFGCRPTIADVQYLARTDADALAAYLNAMLQPLPLQLPMSRVQALIGWHSALIGLGTMNCPILQLLIERTLSSKATAAADMLGNLRSFEALRRASFRPRVYELHFLHFVEHWDPLETCVHMLGQKDVNRLPLLIVQQVPWSEERACEFPVRFKEAVQTLLLCAHRQGPDSAVFRAMVDSAPMRGLVLNAAAYPLSAWVSNEHGGRLQDVLPLAYSPLLTNLRHWIRLLDSMVAEVETRQLELQQQLDAGAGAAFGASDWRALTELERFSEELVMCLVAQANPLQPETLRVLLAVATDQAHDRTAHDRQHRSIVNALADHGVLRLELLAMHTRCSRPLLAHAAKLRTEWCLEALQDALYALQMLIARIGATEPPLLEAESWRDRRLRDLAQRLTRLCTAQQLRTSSTTLPAPHSMSISSADSSPRGRSRARSQEANEAGNRSSRSSQSRGGGNSGGSRAHSISTSSSWDVPDLSEVLSYLQDDEEEPERPGLEADWSDLFNSLHSSRIRAVELIPRLETMLLQPVGPTGTAPQPSEEAHPVLDSGSGTQPTVSVGSGMPVPSRSADSGSGSTGSMGRKRSRRSQGPASGQSTPSRSTSREQRIPDGSELSSKRSRSSGHPAERDGMAVEHAAVVHGNLASVDQTPAVPEGEAESTVLHGSQQWLSTLLDVSDDLHPASNGSLHVPGVSSGGCSSSSSCGQPGEEGTPPSRSTSSRQPGEEGSPPSRSASSEQPGEEGSHGHSGSSSGSNSPSVDLNSGQPSEVRAVDQVQTFHSCSLVFSQYVAAGGRAVDTTGSNGGAGRQHGLPSEQSQPQPDTAVTAFSRNSSLDSVRLGIGPSSPYSCSAGSGEPSEASGSERSRSSSPGHLSSSGTCRASGQSLEAGRRQVSVSSSLTADADAMPLDSGASVQEASVAQAAAVEERCDVQSDIARWLTQLQGIMDDTSQAVIRVQRQRESAWQQQQEANRRAVLALSGKPTQSWHGSQALIQVEADLRGIRAWLVEPVSTVLSELQQLHSDITGQQVELAGAAARFEELLAGMCEGLYRQGEESNCFSRYSTYLQQAMAAAGSSIGDAASQRAAAALGSTPSGEQGFLHALCSTVRHFIAEGEATILSGADVAALGADLSSCRSSNGSDQAADWQCISVGSDLRSRLPSRRAGLRGLEGGSQALCGSGSAGGSFLQSSKLAGAQHVASQTSKGGNSQRGSRAARLPPGLVASLFVFCSIAVLVIAAGGALLSGTW